MKKKERYSTKREGKRHTGGNKVILHKGNTRRKMKGKEKKKNKKNTKKRKIATIQCRN